jgi:dTDP-4-amino-4,6-dideoxygalactose transaminase/nucleoside-diphosphate-sugar epimerase
MTFPPKIPIVKPVVPIDRINQNLASVLASGVLTKGRCLREFEEAAAQYMNVKHAVAVSSGTTGLMLTYWALNLRGEVIVPSFTFMATASALVWAGVKPVFVETDLQTKNVDPNAIEEKITPRTSAIIAVHNFGNPAAIDELRRIAERHNLKLIFDAAHALGSTYRNEPIGSQGDAQVFSLSPTKLVIAGEGGIITTNDTELAMRLRCGREYGNDGRYDSAFAGLNGRLPEVSALLASESLRSLDSAVENRNAYAQFYRKELSKLRGIGFQAVAEGDRSAYKDFCITVDENEFGLSRDELASALAAENIETRSYYNPPVHLQTAYRQFAAGDLPATEKLARECLSLPMWSQMDSGTLKRVCRSIEGIRQRCARSKRKRQKANRTVPASSACANKKGDGSNGTKSLLQTDVRVGFSLEANGFLEDDSIQDLMALSRIRNVEVKELLRRPAVERDRLNILTSLEDKTVLVTGAGGSIGSELARQLATYPLRKLILLDRSEYGLFLIERELAERVSGLENKAVIADVCDSARMNSIFRDFLPQVVFHAAAHKHVSLMEENALEAVKNNILGTYTTATIAGEFGAEAFVLISTDKAVRPTSVMGASKRVAELTVQELNQSYGTRFLTVRFGNVIGSTGSVTTIFREQIKRGGPVTVTHPKMERYFMTIPEAANLVLQAVAIGEGGEIFILDMGEPVKILDLAKELIRVSGLNPETDIKIVFTGVRRGEKLCEQLQTEKEQLAKTRHPQIFIGRISPYPPGTVQLALKKLSELYLAEDHLQIREFLGKFLPEAQLTERQAASPGNLLETNWGTSGEQKDTTFSPPSMSLPSKLRLQ